MTVEDAKELCILAHKGQFRRDGVTPYSEHPIAVADMLETDEEKVIAYLHDVIEDTPATLHSDGHFTFWVTHNSIDYQLDDTTYLGLNLLTKKPNQPYAEYIQAIADDYAYYNNEVLKVKLSDIHHNLSCNPTERAKTKYLQAVKILLASL